MSLKIILPPGDTEMKISILCVGKIKEGFYREAVSEYAKRLSRYCKLEICEVADEKTPEQCSDVAGQQILEREGERLARLLKPDAFCIALAIEGKKMDSCAFSGWIDRLGINGTSHIQFLIGGSLGLSDRLLRQADARLSFSDMTFPHQLMRVILLEQIYRGYRIMNHEPYHK